MFDIGWSELVVIGIVALIAIGPKELPGVLRTVGQYMGKIRRMASEFQGQFQEAMREAEMADIKKQVDEMTDVAKDFTHFDPLQSVKNEFDAALGDAPKPEAAAPENAAPVTAPIGATESASPEVAATAVAAPAADLAIAPESPQPVAPEPKGGSGA
jgi:sec-independent protein translocase protein TatB